MGNIVERQPIILPKEMLNTNTIIKKPHVLNTDPTFDLKRKQLAPVITIQQKLKTIKLLSNNKQSEITSQIPTKQPSLTPNRVASLTVLSPDALRYTFKFLSITDNTNIIKTKNKYLKTGSLC